MSSRYLALKKYATYSSASAGYSRWLRRSRARTSERAADGGEGILSLLLTRQTLSSKAVVSGGSEKAPFPPCRSAWHPAFLPTHQHLLSRTEKPGLTDEASTPRCVITGKSSGRLLERNKTSTVWSPLTRHLIKAICCPLANESGQQTFTCAMHTGWILLAYLFSFPTCFEPVRYKLKTAFITVWSRETVFLVSGSLQCVPVLKTKYALSMNF